MLAAAHAWVQAEVAKEISAAFGGLDPKVRSRAHLKGPKQPDIGYLVSIGIVIMVFGRYLVFGYLDPFLACIGHLTPLLRRHCASILRACGVVAYGAAVGQLTYLDSYFSNPREPSFSGIIANPTRLRDHNVGNIAQAPAAGLSLRIG